MKEEIIITQGKYIASAVRADQYPEGDLPEVVFIGRSNVGKSSLINSLSRVGGLARVSGTPGKTQTINFYELSAKIPSIEERRSFFLVDLPGYGYAKTGQANRKVWAKFIEEYLLKSPRLQFVCQLIDIRHDPMKSDIEMFNWLVENNLPVLIIATKADKLSKNAVQKQVKQIKKVLGVPDLDVLPYSSVKSEGRSDLLDVISTVLVE
ncbi:ribosome biogenesis GTP-binding protein YihA/YsxC [Anaerosinus gibii]|uniref:Probable GTP-binding protein EngB n=1 Tax=Selenobaculum gibii TaxID=3054208 RepID=A0A9Y2AE61_9FIRM|nr:ribosome biogenesis GTP-binding protein YihA/YsxC [Selenobaculum gbiensis]WIW69895.1 ribosome biogenesis GTP-binding protein YihA/YsxC [Selenobaculum gbiensis]